LWLLIALVLLAGVQSRTINFINSCTFAIDVEGTGSTGVVCSNLGPGASCQWGIPDAGWSGNFHRRNADGSIYGFPSATLAEFTLANNQPSQWNWDWFDISIIPPGCGSETSYDSCWCDTGADGYDVGMTITPLASSCSGSGRTCLGRACAGAYNYPSDNSKTTVCQDITGDWDITFCPSGSFTDLGATETSQVPPCQGGQSTPPPPPPSSGYSCTLTSGVDYYGNDISNQPTSDSGACCDYCASVANCQCWTYANGVCYAKTSVPANPRSNSGLVSGQLVRSNAVADTTDPTYQGANGESTNLTWVWVGVGVGVGVVVLIALIIAIALLLKNRQEERA